MRIEKKKVAVGSRPDGSEMYLPVIEMRGDKGPSVFISMTVHGNEVTGHKSIWYLMDHLEGMELRGSITIASLVNADAFNYTVRGFPYSTLDLNRMFPGDSKGSLPDRIAAKVWDLASRADFVLDLHTAGLCIPFVLIHPAGPLIRDFIHEVALSSGLTCLYNYDPSLYSRIGLNRSLTGVAVSNNVPALTVELPGTVGIDELGARAGFIAIKNILLKLDMIDGEEEEIDFFPVIKGENMRRMRVLSRSSGLLDYRVGLGEEVEEGSVLAVIRDPFGNEVEEVVSPKRGYVVQLNGFSRVFTGGKVATLAIEMES